MSSKERCNMFPFSTFYFFDNSWANEMSRILHGIRATQPCPRCLCSSELLVTLELAEKCDRADTEKPGLSVRLLSRKLKRWKKHHVSAGCIKVPRAVQVLHQSSLSSVPFFLDNNSYLQYLFSKDVFSRFTFEPQHNFHLGISKLKNFFANYLSSRSIFTSPKQAMWSNNPFSTKQTATL